MRILMHAAVRNGRIIQEYARSIDEHLFYRNARTSDPESAIDILIARRIR